MLFRSKGMRVVRSEAGFDQACASARRESASSFGSDDLLVEKYLSRPRHVEFQVFCDRHGGAVYLFERDCSVQRRFQKVIEVAPSFLLKEEIRQQLFAYALAITRQVGYSNAGTVEFLIDAEDRIYFI